jgi:predicted transport protein
MRLFSENKTYNEFQFDKESDFEKEVIQNSKLFFGSNSIYIDAKRKIESKSLGKSIPDGFLFNLSDKNDPEFYIVEVELAKHDFYNHIFPQITKFFGFFKNQKSQTDLVEKIFSIITNDNNLKKEFKKYLGDKEIYKFLKDTIEKNQNIILVIDGEKKELPEIMETYSDTWGKMVKLILLKKFYQNDNNIYTMHPDFENIEFVDIESDTVTDKDDVEYDEDYHLDGVSLLTINIFKNIKKELLHTFPSLVFNPQKFYISIRNNRNIAFFKIQKKKINLVVMNPEEETRKVISKHTIKSLTPGVQKFWNGPSCAIIVESTENLQEVISLLKILISNTLK